MDNLHIPITGDNQNFLNALNGAKRGVRETAKVMEAVCLAEAEANETVKKQNEFEEAKNRAQQTLKENTEKADQGLDNFTNAVSKIDSGSLYGFANRIVKLVNSFKGVINGFSEVGGIIGAILQIIDALGDDSAQFIL